MNSSIVKSIRKNDNDFSFISTFFDLIGNKEFKTAELNTLYTEKETLKTSIWRALSAIGQDIGSSFYENILNFSDNILNVDVCKVKQLQSMIDMIGISYTIFSNVNNMPYEILLLIDIFSIKDEYLTSYIMNKDFVLNLSSKMLDDEYYTEISDFCQSTNDLRQKYNLYDNNITSTWKSYNGNFNLYALNKVDPEKLKEFTIDVFKCLLRDKLELNYNSKSEIEIYKVLSSNILLSDFALPNNYLTKIYNDKLKYNISPTFNVEKEVDNIENFKTILSDYSEYELIVLNYEIKRREDAYLNLEPKTRYKYYRERDLKEYVTYINNEYCNVLSNYLSSLEYNVDKNYIQLFNITDKKSVFTKDLTTGEIVYHDYYINSIAKHLYDIAITIRDIRELIKLQFLKNYLRGTKLLLKYSIEEFLKNNIVNDLCNIGINYEYDQDNNNVDIIEYVDPIEYFNISACTDIDRKTTYLNDRYWENNTATNRIGAIDNTNIFAKLPTLESLSFEFNTNNIKDFYIDNLNMKLLSSDDITSVYKTEYSNINNLLNLVFNIGADESFLSNNIVYDYKLYELTNTYIQNSSQYIKIYNDISVKYYNVESYIDQKYDGANKSISLQLNEICANLSSSDSSDIAITKIYELSNSIDNINELYSIVNIRDFTTYLSTKYDNALIIYANDISNYISSDYYKYKCTLFYKYIGLSVGDTPYYYLKNKTHPSFLIHLYLSNFIEKTESDFAIKNTNNIETSELSTLLINDISNYIDNSGYLINIWKNPLNSNTDYISKYEATTHTDENNNENEVFGYDGFCYPPALAILNNDTLFNKFIEMIQYDIEVKHIKYNNNIIHNYYYGLNLTKELRVFIAALLQLFRHLIYDIAVNDIVDIYKYGLDIYNNSYCLIKKYDNCENRDDILNCQEDVKKYATGALWIRIKNHPFPFPAFAFNTSNIEENMISCSLIDYEHSDAVTSNLSYKNFNRQRYNSGSKYDFYLPKIQDFTFSLNKQLILINGEIFDDKTVLTAIGSILKFTDTTKYVNRDLIFIKNIYNYSTLNLSSDLIKYSRTNNWQFENFYLTDSKNGIIFSQVLNDNYVGKYDISISLMGWYYNQNSLTKTITQLPETLVEELKETYISCENVCTDIHDDIITIAYIGENLNSNTDGTGFNNYIGQNIIYEDLSNYNTLTGIDKEIEYINSTIVSKDFQILNSRFIKIGSDRDIYAKYTDIGCFGLVDIGEESSPRINNISDSKSGIINELENIRGMYKFLILSESKTLPIDFKFFILVRMRELYAISSLNADDCWYSIADFLSVHSYEALANDNTKSLTCYSKLSSDTSIYSPIELKQILEQYQPAIQIDENYVDNKNSFYDPYIIDPYIYVGKSDSKATNVTDLTSREFYDIPTKYKKPFNMTDVGDDTCIFKTIASNEVSAISVSWYKHDNGNIQLDFNSLYAKTNSSRVKKENEFNKKHLFLNLDKPGAAGYLNIYNNPFIPENDSLSDNAYIRLATYYLKNISDDKPKFVLSVEYMKNLDYTNIVNEESESNIALKNYNQDLMLLVTEELSVIRTDI